MPLHGPWQCRALAVRPWAGVPAPEELAFHQCMEHGELAGQIKVSWAQKAAYNHAKCSFGAKMVMLLLSSVQVA